MMEDISSFIIFSGIAILVLLVALVGSAVKIISQHQRGVVTRLGKYVDTKGPGLVFIIPFIEDIAKVDVREQVVNVHPQQVITKDNVTVVVDGVIYYKVVDSAKSIFEINNFALAASTLAQTNLRNLIGDKSLDESLTARDAINLSLRDILDEATNPWGVKVTRVELQRIDPPKDIADAMSRQMKAERDKRAAILEAEGFKQSEILKAEGEKQSQILEAQGKAEAQITIANAEAESIRLVSESAQKYFTGTAITNRQLEVLQNSLKDNTKFILPSDSKVLNLLELNSMLKD
jgi:regulator of protease activity HflC (stomatin/prohibitin superfamily)